MPNSNKDLAEQVKRLALIVERMTPAIAPIPAIPAIPAIPPIIPPSSGDHDLLTKLDTKVDQIQSDVTDLKKQSNSSVTQAQFSEVVRIQADHESRTRALESSVTKILTWGTSIMIIIGVGEALLQIYFKTH